MAEIINKPPKFTKEWFNYIWCYYKVHILIAIAAVALIIFTIYDFASIIKYDIKLSVITSDVLFSQEAEIKLSEKMEEVVGDINQNGESDAHITQLNFSESVLRDAEMRNAAENKLLTLLVSEDEMLFLCDENMVKYILNMKMTENAFIPVNEWGSPETEGELGYEFKDGVYAASLKNSSILKEAGIDGDNLYIMVKMNLNTEDEDINKKFSASCDFAKKVIK